MHKHTNRLIEETSPYLLQHAHNPVDWYPWGEEALQKAKAENKPILVSIGYSACHWCHVMERESFENEEVAAIMNESFVNIKIDREERPDIDHIYMDAVQAMTGSGGWPLNVFLTPDAKPFYGGTYFPPVNAYNRASWKETLYGIKQAFVDRRGEIDAQAEQMTKHLQNSNIFGFAKQNPSIELGAEQLQLMTDNLLKNADTVWGGFGNAPKFPQTFSIQFLLRQYHFAKTPAALQQALLSLDKMIYGGIYDQLGGGFARYSTDEQWLAPHFEKMLYDNALLLDVMSEAYQLTQKQLYADTIRHTMTFIEREMWNKEEQAFYSALDADSEGVEGKFYTWSKKEIDEVLGEDAGLFCAYFDVHEEGNWEHTNVLRVLSPYLHVGEEKNEKVLQEKKTLQKDIQKLLQVREQRIRPGLDDKILLSWNALMITACCKAAAALNEPHYVQLAEQNYAFIKNKMRVNEQGVYLHTYKNGQAKYPAFLDDYAYLIEALLHLQEASGSKSYIKEAAIICAYVIDHFSEKETGFFYFTSDAQTDVIVRKKEVYDGATPSGNGVMAKNLHYLGILLNKPEWIERSNAIVQALHTAIIRYPSSFGVWASLLQQQVYGTYEIVVIGHQKLQWRKEILQQYIPNKILQSADAADEQYPLLAGKGNEDSIYLCKDYACKRPVQSTAALLELM
jgi:uncharacterized protein